MTVDAERLRSLLDRLRTTEQELTRLRDLGSAAVRNDVDRLYSVKYLFVMTGRSPSTPASTSSPPRASTGPEASPTCSACSGERVG
jgi:hypothetical protein